MDAEEYIHYYNHGLLHIKRGDLRPVNDDNLQPQVSCWTEPEYILGIMKCGHKTEET